MKGRVLKSAQKRNQNVTLLGVLGPPSLSQYRTVGCLAPDGIWGIMLCIPSQIVQELPKTLLVTSEIHYLS